MDTKFDFGELENESNLKKQIIDFQESINKISEKIDVLINSNIYNSLSIKDKINYDLFISYTLCTLYWMYIKCSGSEDKNDAVKIEINRVKECMQRYKTIEEKRLRPLVNQQAAKRVVKHNIWDPKNKKQKTE